MTSISTTERRAKDGSYWSPPYRQVEQTWTNINSVMDSRYRKKVEENMFSESPLLKLLNEQTKKAAEEMRNELNKQLWGTPQPKGLREIISDAYDEVIGTEQESEMSAVDEVMKERKEARARDVLYKLDGILNEDIELVVFEVTFSVGGKVYEYAARLAGDGCWYVTGKDTVGRKPEEFKGFIAEKALEAHEVVFEGEVL